MNATTYSGWKANQVRVLERVTCDQRDRYLRGIALVWGEVVSADIESAFNAAKGGDLYAEESTDEARERWEAAQARLLRMKKARAERTRHPLNAGSRGMAKDPAAVLEEREAQLCKGCLYEYRVTIVGDVEYGCSRGFSHGVRCSGYWDRHAR